ncbi:hypothetical protein PUND_b0623 [Pseudoalteromonas undina]|jgi:hypothetical protein|nr:hypothetical protein PSM_B0492 [Pseudoalteromonas sp. SM9913]KAF7763262.1 hypothetical protein PUND_b0623 [Pseudoalteromonas undina]GAA63775.1 hypothetical protein P20311_1565 [Pseudoalteromonas sp. BSi20311]GAA71509.1 hypothetical protein P20439_1583 [Pseudoalteromonas sp. BSi20439]
MPLIGKLHNEIKPFNLACHKGHSFKQNALRSAFMRLAVAHKHK